MAPKRKTAVQTVKSDLVQGEGSWVKVRRLKWGEIKRLSRRQSEIEGDPEAAIEITDEMLAEHVLEWNWVDEDDHPLPQPHGNQEVIDGLTDEEFEFLADAIAGSERTRKN